jgi:hypothetical protein
MEGAASAPHQAFLLPAACRDGMQPWPPQSNEMSSIMRAKHGVDDIAASIETCGTSGVQRMSWCDWMYLIIIEESGIWDGIDFLYITECAD